MLNSNYLRSISRSLLFAYALSTNPFTTTPSYAQEKQQKRQTLIDLVARYDIHSPVLNRAIDSLIVNYSHLAKSSRPRDFISDIDPKFEYAKHIEKLTNKYRIEHKGKNPPKLPDMGPLNEINSIAGIEDQSTYITPEIKPQTNKTQAKQDTISTYKKPKSLSEPLPKKPSILETKAVPRTRYNIYIDRNTQSQKPTRIVRRSTKLKLIQGELPQGTSIVTTQDDSDFLKTPVKTNYYSFPSAWSLITGLRLAPAHNDSISDLLASALPEVRKYMDDLGVSETIMRRFEIDDKKIVGGRTLKGSDGLPLDNIYPTDDLFWSARVLAKRDYKHITPQVEQKALEQIAGADTVYLKLEQPKPDTVFVQKPAPQPITQTTQITKVEHKKDNTLLYIGAGLVAGGLLYLILKGKKEKEQPPQQPTGVYTQDGGNGVTSPKIIPVKVGEKEYIFNISGGN